MTSPTRAAHEESVFRRLAFFALVLLAFTLPWQATVAYLDFLNVTKLLGVVAAGGAALGVVGANSIRFRSPSLFLVAFALFFLWLTMSYFWSIEPSETLDRIQTFAQLLVMGWLVWELCRTDRQRYALFQAYVIGSYIPIASALIVFYAAQSGDLTGGYRIAAEGFDENWMSAFLALGIPVAWYMVLVQKNRFLFSINVLYIPLAVLTILLAASRGGTIAALVALTVIPFTYAGLGFWKRLVLVTILGASAAFLFTTEVEILPDLSRNIQRVRGVAQDISEGDLNQRLVIWSAGLEVLGDRPVAGFGAGNFRYAVAPLLQRPRAAHNTFLSIAVDLGLVGFALFILLLAIAVAPSLSRQSRTGTFQLVLFCTLVLVFVPLNLEGQRVPWFLVFMLTTHRAYVVRPVGWRRPTKPEPPLRAFDTN